MIDASELKNLLDYDPETGVFRWKERPLEAFTRARLARTWNTKYAGKQAGYLITRPNGDRYVRINILGEKYYAHRVAWAIVYGYWPKDGIDHRDGNGLNNRFANLREADHVLNGRNQRRRVDNTSGFNGVYWSMRDKRWYARIMRDGALRHIGCFANLPDAIRARKNAEAKIGGFTERHGMPQ